METIFTLIIVLLPIIFKLIGKKLEQSGAKPQHSEQQEQIEDWAEVLRRHIEMQQEQQTQSVQVMPVQEESAVPEKKDIPKQKKTIKSVKPAKPILQEEESKAKEKIDTKKLIVYSEIMKPKYTE